MAHVGIRQRGRNGGQCPSGLDEDIAEVETIILKLRAEYDEKLAHLHDYVRHLEGLVGTLTAAVAANQLRLTQTEGFIASLGALSRALVVEAERLSSE